MKINANIMSNGFRCALAEQCAEQIKAMTVRLHLRALLRAGLAPDHPAYNSPPVDENFRDVRAIIAGIEDKWERRAFVILVKHYYAEAMQGFGRSARQYVAEVAARKEAA